eukprot:TRINITY_DN24621_c0_g1_i1.p1 TRINITY_DN24621_c0_g1~~TRINITY_DN24621_c0_g1_i1.p1  ORF type:complete len:680 (+),score=173.15 TRINITY_DN24621_c0_g1_i1:54-2042(+)
MSDPTAEGSEAGALRETYKLYVFENERLFGKWTVPKLPADRPHWTDSYGTALEDKEGIDVPIKGGKWIDAWTPEDWRYAFDFNISRFHDKKTLKDFVRERRWVRQYEGPTDSDFIPPLDPDVIPVECALCGKEFGSFVLEHHCRTCHLAVCGSCSRQSMSTPGYCGEQRCCNECATANGIKITGWYLGKSLKRRVQNIRGTIHSDMQNPSKEVVCLNTELPSCGVVKVRLHECRDVTGWAGEMGTPNPHVEFYLTGSYIKTKGKVQTHSPKWSEAEASFDVPCTDPTASLYFCVYDMSGLGIKRPLGRGAVPLTSLSKEKGKEMWIDLLPCGEQEAAGYNAEQPKPFRGCSSVTEVLGMHDPKRPLGFIKLSVSYAPTEKAILGVVPPAYVKNEVFRNPVDPGNEVFRLKDSAARLSAEMGPPTVLKYLWENGLYAAAAVPVWCAVAWAIEVHHVPYLVALVVVANGLLLSKVRKPREIILYEENNPYKTPTLWKKVSKMSRALKFTAALHNPVGKAATALSKSSSLFSYEDPGISGLATIFLFVLSILASLLISFLSIFPLRLYVCLIGSAVILLPSDLLKPKKDTTDEDDDEPTKPPPSTPGVPSEPEPTPPPKPVATVLQGCVNFLSRVPDDLELMHRQICEGQVRAGPGEKNDENKKK